MIKTLNSKQVAELLHWNIRTVQRKAENGDFPKNVCVKCGRNWLFHAENLMIFIFGDVA